MKSQTPQPLTEKQSKDLKLLVLFTRTYCRDHHRSQTGFCSDCRSLLRYARARLSTCPLDPKPKCKHCHVHCYKPLYREQVRAIMRYSGKALIKRGRIDLLWPFLR